MKQTTTTKNRKSTTRTTKRKAAGNSKTNDKDRGQKVARRLIEVQIEQSEAQVNIVKGSYRKGLGRGFTYGVFGILIMMLAQTLMSLAPIGETLPWILTRVAVALAMGTVLAHLIIKSQAKWEGIVDETLGEAVKMWKRELEKFEEDE